MEPSRSRPRGRPQVFPVDQHPAASGQIDHHRRLAWLLATSRVLSPDAGVTAREEFMRRLADDGISVDSARVSRWESGRLRPSAPVLGAYERHLGLADGAVTSFDRMLARTSGRSLSPVHADPAPDHAELDELFAAAEEGRATGGQWLRLAAGLGDVERVYVHRDTWRRIAERLVNEITRSSGLALTRRSEAASVLLNHPRARGHLSRQVGEFVMHPDAQNIVPPLGLLLLVADKGAADLLLRLLGSENRLLRRGASEVAGSMAAVGLFDPSRAMALERHVGHEMRGIADLRRRLDVLDIASQLPDDGFGRLLAATGDARVRRSLDRARETRELVDPDLARNLSEAVATFAEAVLARHAHEPDQLLRRLVREAMFSVQRERRHLASVTLGLSPYARAVGRSLLDLTRDDDDIVAGMAWSVLRRLGHVIDRETLAAAAAAERRPGLRARAFLTLGLCHGPLPDDAATDLLDAARETVSGSVGHAALFALGMARHDSLHLLARESGTSVGRAASWWVELGPALHDRDVVPVAG